MTKAAFACTTTDAGASAKRTSIEDNDKLIQRNENEVITSQEMDAIIAREMTKLTINDRNKVLHELHGVAHDDDDDDDKNNANIINNNAQKPTTTTNNNDNNKTFLIETQKVQELRQELDKLLISNPDSAFAMAVQQDKDYVYQEPLLIRFLRGDDFQVMTSAPRIFLYYEKKLELFGTDKLGRDICQSDLSPQDLEGLYSGYAQYLPCLDRAGRIIFLIQPSLRGSIDPIHMARAMWYLGTHSGTLEKDFPTKGCVVIVYHVDRGNIEFKNTAHQKIGNTIKVMPLRTAATHICYNDPKFKVFASVLLLFVDKHFRLRTRLHFGSALECQYKLMTFGIPQHALPFDDNNNWNDSLEHHYRFLQTRKQHEEAKAAAAAAVAAATAVAKMKTKQVLINEQQQQKDQFVYNNNIPQLQPNVHEPVIVLNKTQVALPSNKNNNNTTTSTATIYPPPIVPNTTTTKPELPLLLPKPILGGFDSISLSSIPNYHNASAVKIYQPQPQDVLFGKGRAILTHPGNVQYIKLVESFAEKYEAASKAAKTDITREILQRIQNSPGRFLKRNNPDQKNINCNDNDNNDCDYWVQVSNKEARNKISHAFRSRRAVMLSKDKREA